MRLSRNGNFGHVTFNPFAELDRFFGSVGAPATGAQGVVLSPSAEIYETPEALEVRVDLPGFNKDSIGVELENGILTLSAERKESVQEGAVYFVTERRFGKFERQFKINQPVDAERVAASYTDGVLSVTLPKRAEAKARKINVTTTRA
jgi:HSP20 family protein